MSIKRTTYKGFSFPDDDTYLNVRPAFTRMCMENRAASKLLSALIFKWELSPDVDIENVTSFCIQLTQAEIIKAMCDEATAKTIHDVAMPCLHLFGYADVDESTYPFTYTVHVDRVREGLAYCKQGMKQLEEILIVWAGEKGLATIDGERLNKKKLYIALEEVLIIIRGSSNSIGKSSNSRRGRKPSAQAASDTQIGDPKNYKHFKHKKEQERESSVSAPLSDIAIAHPTPPPVSVFADENLHVDMPPLSTQRVVLSAREGVAEPVAMLNDEADRAVIAHMLSQQSNPNSVFYMPPAPTQPVPALVADIAATQKANAVTVTTEPLPHNPIAATNAPKSPKAKQDAAQPPLLTVTLTEPTMNAEWSAETCVQYVEWKNKKRYDDLKRMKQLDAARTAKRVDPTLTLARFQLAYDDWFVWWKDKKKGSLHVSDMNVKQENTFTRLENALNRIDDESERRDKRKTFSVITGNKPAQVQQPPKKEQSQEDMDAAKAAYERMMARKQQAVAK